ncbi:MAG: DUF2087 domain-containing protein [Oscillospiraceae bacterium]|jgi:hypothetical protein|nr:DUF2087 domain-containing protein [Oscillospiraceae bacterium]
MVRNLEQELDELRAEVACIREQLPPTEQPPKLLLAPNDKVVEQMLTCIGVSGRPRLLLALLRRSLTVAQLAEVCDCGSRGQIYHHLKPLIAAGLVEEDRSAARGTYCVPMRKLGAFRQLIDGAELLAEEVQAQKNGRRGGENPPEERCIFVGEAARDIREIFFGEFELPVLERIPTDEKKKMIVLRELTALFEPMRDYTEREINETLRPIYENYAELRECLIDYGFLERTRNGKEYWVNAEPPTSPPAKS